MSRRSSRLTSSGYYNLRSQPTVSYKETPARSFRRSWRCSQDSSSETTSYRIISPMPDSNSRTSSNDSSNMNFLIARLLLFILAVFLGIVSFCHLNTYDELAKRVRGLEDEVLSVNKRINYLPPGDTMPNFALESQGAHVFPHLSSKTYHTKASGSFYGIPISPPSLSPRTVTQGEPTGVGRCWPFHGEHGQLVIALSHPVTISHVTLGHISKNLSPTGTIQSAPKVFAVYGMKTTDDDGTLLGTFLYDHNRESVKTFKLSDPEKGVFRFVKLQVESNWGHPEYTCVYNFRVHGTIKE